MDDIDDRESAVRETNSPIGGDVQALVIRAAMHKRVTHPYEQVP